MKFRILSLVALVLILTPVAFAADFGLRAGRISDADSGTGNDNEEFVGVEVLFDAGPVNINPNIEYWLLDAEDVTAGTVNLDVTIDILKVSSVTPYVGAGVGLFYVDDDFGSSTETLGNLIGGVQIDLVFLKPYGQVKYTRSLEDDNGGDNDTLALTVGLRF